MTNKLMRADLWVIRNICMPLTSAVDQRFHINPWKLAANVMMASAFLAVIDISLYDIIGSSTAEKCLWVFLGSLILMARALDIRQLTLISDKYEKRPDIMPMEWLYFIQPISRLCHIIPGIILFFLGDIVSALTKAHGSAFIFAVYFIPRMWYILAGIGYYIAAVPRPPAKRKEKKVHAPMFGELARVKS